MTQTTQTAPRIKAIEVLAWILTVLSMLMVALTAAAGKDPTWWTVGNAAGASALLFFLVPSVARR